MQGAQRDSSRWGNLNNALPQLLQWPPQELSAHLPTQEGAPGHKGRWENPNNDIRETKSLPRSFSGCCSKASASSARDDTQHHVSARAGNRMRPLVPFVFLRVLRMCLCWSVWPAMCICLWVSSVQVFVCIVGNTSSVSLLVRPEGTELQQPSFCWATGFGKPNQWPWIKLANSKYSGVRKHKIVWT